MAMPSAGGIWARLISCASVSSQRLPSVPAKCLARLGAALLTLGAGVAVQAHDFWIQPARFQTAASSSLTASLLVGHGEFRQRSPIPARRIVRLSTVGPDGMGDQRGGLSAAADGSPQLNLRFTRPGTYVVTLATDHAKTELPAIRFNDYLRVEGLSPASEFRRRNGTENEIGREIYNRCAKALIAVGGRGSDEAVTRAVGLPLEIVPQRSPAGLRKGEALPVVILYQGRPLAGALVKLTDLNADARPVSMQRSDANGRARFQLPRPGQWLVNVIWTRPTPRSNAADFETTFSSLAFAWTGPR